MRTLNQTTSRPEQRAPVFRRFVLALLFAGGSMLLPAAVQLGQANPGQPPDLGGGPQGVLSRIAIGDQQTLAQRQAQALAQKAFLERARLLYKDRMSTRSFAGRTVPRTVLTPYEESIEESKEARLLSGDAGSRSNWSPYIGPFGLAEASHVLHRTMIGPRLDEMHDAQQAGLASTVDNLLAPRALPAPPGDWVNEPLPDFTDWTQEMFDSLFVVYYTRFERMRLWWPEVMLADDPGIHEAMTLFWHDHFATAGEKVFVPSTMFQQHTIFRTHAVGNFKDLVYAVSFDPAMLIWLDGVYSYVGNVNENFARELLELFTMGVDEYTQADVVAAARAFTGYTTYDWITTVFEPWAHDNESKTFLGQVGNWDGPDIIEIIFQQPETARFICRKLYQYFIDQYPDEALVEDLAQTMRDNNYEIAPVLARMFKSQHFMDVNFRSSVYSDGIDRSAGVLRSFYLDNVDLSDQTGPQASYLLFSMYLQGLILFEPPNVGGWPGYRSWVNSYTLPWKRLLCLALVDEELFGDDLQMQFDGFDLAAHVTDPNDPDQIVDQLSLCFFGMAPSPQVRQALMNELLQGMDPDEWSILMAGARERIEGLMRLIIRMADFQLK